MSTYTAQMLSRVMLNEKHPRAGDVTLSEFAFITTADAIGIFDARPDLDILFVYFKRDSGRELNACFQRCFLQCAEKKAEPLTKADLTMD